MSFTATTALPYPHLERADRDKVSMVVQWTRGQVALWELDALLNDLEPLTGPDGA